MKRLKQILSVLLVCCMVFTIVPITAEAITVDGNNVTAKQYYPITGISGNNCWEFCGLIVDESNKVHIVLGNMNQNNKLDELATLYIIPENGDAFCFGYDYESDGMTPQDELKYEQIVNDSFILSLVDENGNILGKQTITAHSANKTAKSYFIFEIGGMEILKSSFKIGLETKTGGEDSGGNAWDIGSPPKDGETVTVRYDYGITKTVENDEDGDTVFENYSDERITYTVTIENKSGQEGDGSGILLPIHVEYVYDHVPDGLIVELEDNQDAKGENLYSYKKDADGNDIKNQLVLDSHVTLTPDGDTRTKTYTVIARIDPDFKGGVVRNRAVMGGSDLIEKEANVDVTINSYFYVHHILNDGQLGSENGVEKRVDKILFNEALGQAYYVDTNVDGKKDENDEIVVNSQLSKFNLNATGGGVNVDSLIQFEGGIGDDYFISGNYDGLLKDTLYGGTFNMTEGTVNTYTDPYKFDDGENGIGFTPKVNEHYYVWEPTNKYLVPMNLAVWHTHGDWSNPNVEIVGYHTITGYPLAAVDRVNYQEFGFIEDTKTQKQDIYNRVESTKKIDIEDKDKEDTQILTSWNAYHLTGFLGCYEFPDKIFNEAVTKGVTFQPYWVTHDGVKVTGIKQRNAKYKGIDKDESYKKFDIEDYPMSSKVENYTAPSNQTLKANAMFSDSSMPLPSIPETVGVDFEKITAGKSQNVKAVELKFDLSKFKPDRAWFEINGKVVEGNNVDGIVSATISRKEDIELTIVPHWTKGDKDFTGAAKGLKITKKNVEEITPVTPSTAKRMLAVPFGSSISMKKDKNSLILQ